MTSQKGWKSGPIEVPFETLKSENGFEGLAARGIQIRQSLDQADLRKAEWFSYLSEVPLRSEVSIMAFKRVEWSMNVRWWIIFPNGYSQSVKWPIHTWAKRCWSVGLRQSGVGLKGLGSVERQKSRLHLSHASRSQTA